MFKVNRGNLDKKIIIQEYASYQNENGFEVEEWKDYKTVWSSINGLFGKEYFAAKATQSESVLDFLVRYSKDLEVLFEKDGTSVYRIIWNKRTYDITYVDNIKYENRFIKIKALLTRNS
ncbi:phage head closure protein [Clostridium gasigenes]|uniref:phage head closure protein n=1 Tax=Clostridium gasigenes TaxID=94869 RepID=UPI0016240DC5|nr:phage head closure protein [Clostridium gasigenes]MBB6622169.1 phage head closure protein [Clostridium gasigenes]